jgi:cytochrome c oxidase cbb3-type subunit 3
MTRTHRALVPIACVCALALVGCEREKRSFEPPPSGARIGATADARMNGAGYVENAYALANGKRLFDWYNCSGCHAHGGGGSGPALMDDAWIYGSEPRAVYQSIFEGRPNGMPSFGQRVSEDQLWQLVAYVRSMSGLAPKNAATSRDDALQAKPSENRMEPPSPARATASAASQQP